MSDEREPLPEERELEELLRRLPREPVDPEAQARARAAFLGAVQAHGASRVPGSERTGPGMEAVSEQAFEGWLRRVLGATLASPEARARARAAFLSALAERAGPRPAFSRPMRLLALGLAAAGVLAVTFLLPEAPRWRVRLLAPVVFDETSYRLEDEQRLAAVLEAPGVLVSGDAPTRLSLSDALELELRPNTMLVLPPLPELDGGSPIVFELEAGECFLRTRSGWRGNPLIVRTAFGDVRATGTTFGVLVAESCLCVCVFEGAVEVAGGGRSERVEARSLLQLVQRNDPAPLRRSFSEEPGEHVAALQAFADD